MAELPIHLNAGVQQVIYHQVYLTLLLLLVSTERLKGLQAILEKHETIFNRPALFQAHSFHVMPSSPLIFMLIFFTKRNYSFVLF